MDSVSVFIDNGGACLPGARKELGGSKFIRGHCCFWGYPEIFAPPPKEICGGQLKIIQGGHLKIRGDWEKFKYEGAYKFSWGFEKIEGARLSGGLLQRSVPLFNILHFRAPLSF